jgi:hypothetical protein
MVLKSMYLTTYKFSDLNSWNKEGLSIRMKYITKDVKKHLAKLGFSERILI